LGGVFGRCVCVCVSGVILEAFGKYVDGKTIRKIIKNNSNNFLLFFHRTPKTSST